MESMTKNISIAKAFMKPVNMMSAVPQVTDVIVFKSLDKLQDIIAMRAVDEFGIKRSYEILRTYDIEKYTEESLRVFIGRNPDDLVRTLQQNQTEASELVALIKRLFSNQAFEYTEIIDTAYLTEDGDDITVARSLYNVTLNLCKELISEPWPNPAALNLLQEAGFRIERTYVMGNSYRVVHNDEKLLIYQ